MQLRSYDDAMRQDLRGAGPTPQQQALDARNELLDRIVAAKDALGTLVQDPHRHSAAQVLHQLTELCDGGDCTIAAQRASIETKLELVVLLIHQVGEQVSDLYDLVQQELGTNQR